MRKKRVGTVALSLSQERSSTGTHCQCVARYLAVCGVVLFLSLASAPAAAGCLAADRDVFGFCPDGTYGGST